MNQPTLADSYWVKHSLSVQPHWRWFRAQSLVHDTGQSIPWSDDQPTLRAAAFLRSRADTQDQLLARAVDLFERNGPDRWLLEAHILTGMDGPAIANKLGYGPELVAIYEVTFFDVRRRLPQRIWIAAQTFGNAPFMGFKHDDLGSLWRWVGYRSGVDALDPVVAVTTGVGRELHSPELLESTELFVAFNRLPNGCTPQQLIQLDLRQRADELAAHPSVYHLAASKQLSTREADSCGPPSLNLVGENLTSSHNTRGFTRGGWWETRQRGGRYLYRAVRINGKPRRIYLGTGTIGRIHELLDRQQQRQWEAAQQLRTELQELDRVWSTTWKWSRILAATFLLRSGYYQHHGQWRKVMAKPRNRQNKPQPATPQESADLQARIALLNERANSGDPVALAELRVFLDDHPEVWKSIGDLNRFAVQKWVSLLAGRDALLRESVTRFIQEWKSEITGPGASPTETALAETAVVARLALTHAEFAGASTEPESLTAAKFRQDRHDAALRRFQATMKLLEQIRSSHRKLVSSSSAAVEATRPRLYVPETKVG